MRVIMDYMYKDHLKTKPFCLLPHSLGPEPSAISYSSCPFYYLYPTVFSTSSSNQLSQRIKKEERKERKWNCDSSLDKRLQLHF